jgi:hypothetical protein
MTHKLNHLIVLLSTTMALASCGGGGGSSPTDASALGPTESSATSFATSAPAAAETSSEPVASARIAEVGHSLVNQTMPTYLVDVAQNLGKAVALRAQVIGGTSLKDNWNRHFNAETASNAKAVFGDVFTDLPAASDAYDVFVATELVIPPLPSAAETASTLADWRSRVLGARSDARLYYFSTWAGDTDRAAWYSNTAANGTHFEELIASINGGIDGPKWSIIPGHVAMKTLYDEIGAGKLPWTGGSVDHFFADGFHLNNRGNYYVALVQYATIYKASPVGAAVPGDAGLTNEQATQLQEMAWSVVKAYPYSGLN